MTLLSREEAAVRLGITASLLSRYIAAGRIDATRVGGKIWVLDEEEVERFAALPRVKGFPPHAGSWPRRKTPGPPPSAREVHRKGPKRRRGLS